MTDTCLIDERKTMHVKRLRQIVDLAVDCLTQSDEQSLECVFEYDAETKELQVGSHKYRTPEGKELEALRTNGPGNWRTKQILEMGLLYLQDKPR
jgi:hypothetical protein